MRLSTEQIFRSGLDSMLGTQSRMLETQQQISSEKRIDSAADDPVAMSKIIKLKHQLAVNEQHQANTDASRRRLSLEEVTLGQINTSVDRLRELTIQAGGGILNDQDRVNLAAEVEQRLDELVGLMNTRDAEEEYLFAGNKGHTQPFSIDSAGRYQYQGDDGQRFMPVGSELQIATGDPGSRVFEAAPTGMQIELDSTLLTSGSLDNGVITDREAFQTFQDNLGPATISFDNSTAPPTYEVVDRNGAPVSGGNPEGPLTGIEFQPGDRISFEGVRFDISAPIDGIIEVGGDEGVQNLLESTRQLMNTLKNSDSSTQQGRDQLQQGLDDALINFDGAQDKVIETRTALGARLSTLDSVETSNLDQELFNRQALSSLEDIDLAEAISRFTLLETALQATQATFVKIQGLSLFNFIR
jgi:flagellar hook-associated protein 3 FlgL